MVFKAIMETDSRDKNQTTGQPEVTGVDILSTVRVASSTKDSVHVKWNIGDGLMTRIQGYKVRYQATGSSVVQYSQRLPSIQNDYDIRELHEDTSYKVCLELYTNTSTPIANEACVEATTKTDSLHVALGSAFGAFLALGIVVAFVFLAKWQHTKRRRRRLQKIGPNGDIYHSRDLRDIDNMSELSMQVNESHVKMSELDSQLELDCPNDNIMAIGGELSDCSEEPHSYHSSNYLAGSCPSSNYLTGSHERCFQCDLELSDSHSPRSARSKYSRGKSVESSRSALSRQYSVDSYGSKRATLYPQRSRDSARNELVSQKSHDSGLQPFPRQKSQESDYSDYSPRGSARRLQVANQKKQHSRHHDNKHGYQDNNTISPSDTQKRPHNNSYSPNSQLYHANAQHITNESPLTYTVPDPDINRLSNPDERPPDVRPKHSPRPFPIAKQKTIQCEEGEEIESDVPVNDGGHLHGLRQNISCPNW